MSLSKPLGQGYGPSTVSRAVADGNAQLFQLGIQPRGETWLPLVSDPRARSLGASGPGGDRLMWQNWGLCTQTGQALERCRGPVRLTVS